MSSVVTTFPGQTYTSSNKPSVETLKADIQALETGHNDLQDSVVPASSIISGLVELATTAETTTGTDATRAVTPDGLHDMTSLAGAAWFKDEDNMVSDSAVTVPSQQSVKAYVDTAVATQTSKTYVSPVVKAWDGWMTISDSWSYLSASSVTVPSGAASLYQVGDRVKFTQTTVKYFVISAVTDTTLTFFVNTDYTVANAAISAVYYSHQSNPLGFPHWFNCAVTVDWNGTDPTTPTTTAKYTINGRTLEFYFKQTNTGAGTSNTQVSVDGFPGSALSGSTYNKSCEVTASTATDGSIPDTGSAQSPRGIIYGTTAPTIYAFFPSMSARSVWLSGSYQV